jgi:hypothetical protein
MAKEKLARKPYPSDLTEAQWGVLEPLMAAAHPPRGGRLRAVAPARRREGTLVSASERGSMGEASARLAAPEHRVRLLRMMVRRGRVGQVAGRLASSDSPASGAGAYAAAPTYCPSPAGIPLPKRCCRRSAIDPMNFRIAA